MGNTNKKEKLGDQTGGTCYAHAVAHALARLGFKEEEVLNTVIDKFGKNGADAIEVANFIRSKYPKIHYQVSDNWLELPHDPGTGILSMRLTNDEWKEFIDKNGFADVAAYKTAGKQNRGKGHAMAIQERTLSGITCLNSWGNVTQCPEITGRALSNLREILEIKFVVYSI